MLVTSIALTLLGNVAGALAGPNSDSQSPFTKPIPPYGKWGGLAMALVQRRYPQALIVDYLYLGRQVVSPSTSQEAFKLWLRDDRHEFGVMVRILFNTTTEQVLKISYEETALNAPVIQW